MQTHYYRHFPSRGIFSSSVVRKTSGSCAWGFKDDNRSNTLFNNE